MRDQNHLKLRM